MARSCARSGEKRASSGDASRARAGEVSVYRILAFVAMKLELSWRKAPFRNSGFRKLKPFAGYFTHESYPQRAVVLGFAKYGEPSAPGQRIGHSWAE